MPPNSLGEWMVGRNLPRKKKVTPREVFKLKVATDDETDTDTVSVTYPRTGSRSSSSSPDLKKVRFEGTPQKSAMKRVPRISEEEVIFIKKKQPKVVYISDSGSETAVEDEEEASEHEAPATSAHDCHKCSANQDAKKPGQDVQKKGTQTAPKKGKQDKKAKNKPSKEESDDDAADISDSDDADTESEAEAKPKEKSQKKQQQQQQKQKQTKKQKQKQKNEKNEAKQDNNGNSNEQKAFNKSVEPERVSNASNASQRKESRPVPFVPPELRRPHLMMPPQAKVMQVEHAMEDPHQDPLPNAYFDSFNGICRVYHGQNWGNPYGNLYPTPLKGVAQSPALKAGTPHPLNNPYYSGLTRNQEKAGDNTEQWATQSQDTVIRHLSRVPQVVQLPDGLYVKMAEGTLVPAVQMPDGIYAKTSQGVLKKVPGSPALPTVPMAPAMPMMQPPPMPYGLQMPAQPPPAPYTQNSPAHFPQASQGTPHGALSGVKPVDRYQEFLEKHTSRQASKQSRQKQFGDNVGPGMTQTGCSQNKSQNNNANWGSPPKSHHSNQNQNNNVPWGSTHQSNRNQAEAAWGAPATGSNNINNGDQWGNQGGGSNQGWGAQDNRSNKGSPWGDQGGDSKQGWDGQANGGNNGNQWGDQATGNNQEWDNPGSNNGNGFQNDTAWGSGGKTGSKTGSNRGSKNGSQPSAHEIQGDGWGNSGISGFPPTPGQGFGSKQASLRVSPQNANQGGNGWSGNGQRSSPQANAWGASQKGSPKNVVNQGVPDGQIGGPLTFDPSNNAVPTGSVRKGSHGNQGNGGRHGSGGTGQQRNSPPGAWDNASQGSGGGMMGNLFGEQNSGWDNGEADVGGNAVPVPAWADPTAAQSTMENPPKVSATEGW